MTLKPNDQKKIDRVREIAGELLAHLNAKGVSMSEAVGSLITAAGTLAAMGIKDEERLLKDMLTLTRLLTLTMQSAANDRRSEEDTLQ